MQSENWACEVEIGKAEIRKFRLYYRKAIVVRLSGFLFKTEIFPSMIIRKYGLLLRRLTEEDIEMVRVHRNSQKIAKNMFYQDTITQEMQTQWFVSINNPSNYFFIIEHNGKKVGLISGKAINFEERTLETGIMLWDDACLNTLVPASASLLL